MALSLRHPWSDVSVGLHAVECFARRGFVVVSRSTDEKREGRRQFEELG